MPLIGFRINIFKLPINSAPPLYIEAKIAAFQLQREYLSNFIDGKPNPKAPSAIDFLKATIKKLKAADRTNQNQIDILQEIADEFSVDGQINLEKIEKIFYQSRKSLLGYYG